MTHGWRKRTKELSLNRMGKSLFDPSSMAAWLCLRLEWKLQESLERAGKRWPDLEFPHQLGEKSWARFDFPHQPGKVGEGWGRLECPYQLGKKS